MHPKTRLSWLRWHVYISCFFAPFILLYIVTGAADLIGIDAKNAQENRYEYPLSQAWPKTQKEAKKLTLAYYDQTRFGPMTGKFFDFHGGYSWYNFEQEVLLLQTESPEVFAIEIHRHGWWKQLMLVHKGQAHIGFEILSIAFALAFFISLVSGVVLSLKTPKYRRIAKPAMAVGSITILILFFLPLGS